MAIREASAEVVVACAAEAAFAWLADPRNAAAWFASVARLRLTIRRRPGPLGGPALLLLVRDGPLVRRAGSPALPAAVDSSRSDAAPDYHGRDGSVR